MGIRLALGATPASIQRLVLSRGAMLGIGGVVLGLAAAAGLTRLMQSVLYGVAPVDVLTFAAIGAVILLVVLAASGDSCATGFTSPNPTVALRSE